MRVLLRVQYLNWMTENDKYQKQEARRLQFLQDNDRVQDDGMEENVEQELDELTVLENDLIEIEQLVESSQFFSVQ
jgi:pyocin large subunit-like protein